MDLLSFLFIALSGLALSQAENKKIILGNDGETYNIDGFVSYNKFIKELEDYSTTKLKESFSFIFRVATVKSTAFLSFVTQEKFITLQLLYALSNKDVVYANLLIHLGSSFQTDKSNTLKDWLNININFNRSEIYEIVKYVVRGKENGLLCIPNYFSEQLKFMNEKYEMFERACYNGDKDVVEWFIKSGLDLQRISCNILENTWNRQQISVLRVLLENNYLSKLNLSQIDLKPNVNDKTLVHYAAEFGLVESLKILIKAGADVNALDSKGRTPMFAAVVSNELKMLKILVTLGASVSIFCRDTGDSLLHLAVTLNNIEAVGQLLQLGVPVGHKNLHGETALYKAVINENVKIIYVLAFHGADVDYATNLGNSLLHISCSSGNINIVKTLLLLGAKQDLRNNLDETPIYLAAKMGHTDVINLLISKGVNLQAKDRKGLTLLHRAARLGDMTAATTLIKSGLEVDIKGVQGITPLYSAVDEGNTAMAKFLLTNKANPNSASDGGWSPLHRAALWGFDDIVTLLLGNGALPNSRTNSGWSPMALANEYGHIKVYNIIKSIMDTEFPDIDVRSGVGKKEVLLN